MSFDKIFDLTAGVYFNFYNISATDKKTKGTKGSQERKTYARSATLICVANNFGRVFRYRGQSLNPPKSEEPLTFDCKILFLRIVLVAEISHPL